MHQAESNKPSHCHGQIRRHARASRRCRGLASNGAWRISAVACARIYPSACRARGLPARSCARFFIVMRALGLHISVGVLMLLCLHMRAADFCAVHAFMLLRGTYTFPFQTMHPYFTAARFAPSCFSLNVRSCLLATNTLPTLHDICVLTSEQRMHPCFRAACTHFNSTQRAHISQPLGTFIPDFLRNVCFRAVHAFQTSRGTCVPASERHVCISLPHSACVFHSRLARAFLLPAEHALLLTCDKYAPYFARHMRSCF